MTLNKNAKSMVRGIRYKPIRILGETAKLRLELLISDIAYDRQDGRQVLAIVESLSQQRCGLYPGANQQHSGNRSQILVIRTERANENSPGGLQTNAPPKDICSEES